MKKFTAFLLSAAVSAALLLPMGVTTADGSDIYAVSSENPKFSYCLNSDGTAKVRASDDVEFEGRLTIPKSLDGRSVTAIADRGFIGQQSLKETVIPESVTKIGNNAFSNCYALDKVQIKGEITDIGAYPFFATPFEQKLESRDGYVILNGDILYDYTGNSQNIYIPSGVRVVSGNLFTLSEELMGFKVTKVVVPDSVEYICAGAFYGCGSIESVYFGSGLKSIGEEAFTAASMKVTGYYETCGQKYALDNGLTFEPVIEYGKQSEAVYVDFSDKFRQFYFTDETELDRRGVLVYHRNYNGEKIAVDWEYSAKLTELFNDAEG